LHIDSLGCVQSVAIRRGIAFTCIYQVSSCINVQLWNHHFHCAFHICTTFCDDIGSFVCTWYTTERGTARTFSASGNMAASWDEKTPGILTVWIVNPSCNVPWKSVPKSPWLFHQTSALRKEEGLETPTPASCRLEWIEMMINDVSRSIYWAFLFQ
jgi:hypothetical protein